MHIFIAQESHKLCRNFYTTDCSPGTTSQLPGSLQSTELEGLHHQVVMPDDVTVVSADRGEACHVLVVETILQVVPLTHDVHDDIIEFHSPSHYKLAVPAVSKCPDAAPGRSDFDVFRPLLVLRPMAGPGSPEVRVLARRR